MIDFFLELDAVVVVVTHINLHEGDFNAWREGEK